MRRPRCLAAICASFVTARFAPRFAPVFAAVFATLCALLAAPVAQARLIADAATPVADVTMAPARGAVTIDPADGDGFRPIRFGAGPDPDGSLLAFRRTDGVWNGASVHGLRMHLQNAMAWPVTVRLVLVDRQGGSLSASVGLPPGGPLTLTMPLQPTSPRRWGMTAGPPLPWQREGAPVAVALQTSGTFDRSAIREIRIGIPTADAPQTLRIGKLFLAPPGINDEQDAYAGIVDRYGQYRRGQWPGKVLAADDAGFAAELRGRDDALARGLAGLPDPWGCFVGGRALSLVGEPAGRPGYFRTARLRQADGRIRHLLLTPDGHPFFSTGVNAVQLANSQTYVEGRRFMFSGLPAAGEPLARFSDRHDSHQTLAGNAGAQRGRGFARGERFDFYQANLLRRDGEHWQARWHERTRQRLQAWGFNTIGAWSDDRLTRPEPAPQRPLPYAAIVHVGGDFARLSDGNDWWDGIADPFDPRFERALDAALAEASRERRTDRALIGYFVDNELGWGNGAANDPALRYAVALSALAMDGAEPAAHAKRAFVARLRQRHDDDIGRLNRAWQSDFGDWAALAARLPPARLPDGRRPAVGADLADLQALHAERYFGLVAAALRRHAPNHLYLGSRFASRTPEALAACARWCDVVSFNLYLPSIDVGFEHEAFAALDKPALLTEFHFGSSDRGPFWAGVMPVARDEDRGPAYQRMLESVLANPAFVGAHWFQYLDQPVTGRWLDGENGHLGLVAITDAPWQPFVLSAAATHRQIAARLRRALALD